MSWSVDITPPPGWPDVDEKIASFCNCPGNIFTAVEAVTGKRLDKVEKGEAIEALIATIAEIDKGGSGHFTDVWAVESDMVWSKGKETGKKWSDWRAGIETASPRALEALQKALPYTRSYETFTGHETRTRLREEGVRFLLYFAAGYEVKFTW